MAPFLDPRLVVEPTFPSEMWEKKQDVHAPTPCSTNATIALRSRVGLSSVSPEALGVQFLDADSEKQVIY